MAVAGAIVGGAVGFVVGGPVGLAVGIAAGLAGGLLLGGQSGQKIPTQRIGELAKQTAKEGEPRPIVWGRVRPIAGNIMHCSKPRIVRQEVKGQSSGGKGGKKKAPKQYEERVFRTYAIRICEGPITAVVRVWRNNKLVYDARGNDWGAKNNGVFMRRARFYLGGWSQMPDPTLESIWGAGEVPGYRGTCYMVVGEEDLTDQGGAVPQYIFEVERAEGTYLTSKPYRVLTIDHLASTPNANELYQRDIVITLPTNADYMQPTPGVTEIAATDFIIKPMEYMAVTPSLTLAKMSELLTSKEYIAVTPSVTSIKHSITYDRQSPEGVAPVPSVTEIVLI